MMSLAIAGLVMSGTAMSAQAPSDNMQQKAQIENIVHDYILKNPDVLVQALQSFQQKQMEKARDTIAQTEKKSPQYVDALFHQTADPVMGNPNGKMTVVEFFDYQCPHCVDMSEAIDNLVAANPNIRIVLKEFPIRGPVSVFASKAALAAAKQGKYAEFHKALMHPKHQPLTDASILELAQSVSLNITQLKTDMNSPAIEQQIKDTYKLAQDLQLIGTPAFFVGKTALVGKNAKASEIAFIPGQVDQAQLEEVVKKVS